MNAIVRFSGYAIAKYIPSENRVEFPEGNELNSNAANDIAESLLHETFDIMQQVHADVKYFDNDDSVMEKNCDLAELAKYFNSSDNEHFDREIEVGCLYRHFKGHMVEVIAIAEHTENAGEQLVVYKHRGTGRIWARPYAMFASKVDKNKYPDVEQEYRFEKVDG